MSHAAAPLSVVIITRDAEDHLDDVLRAARCCCDDIVVLDSGSTDRTRAIAASHGVAWHEHPFDGFGPQKQRATALARHDWVLSLDADEVLDGAAVTALRGLEWGRLDSAWCGRILRRNFIGDKEIRHGHWGRDRVVKLFHRGRHQISSDRLHAAVAVTGPVFDLAGSLLHYSYPDAAALFRPTYHRAKADRYRADGRRASAPVLAARAAWAFGASFLLRRGFLDGRLGLVVALAAAVNATVGLTMASEPAPGSVSGED